MKAYICMKSFQVDLLDDNEDVVMENGLTVNEGSVWEQEEEEYLTLVGDKEYINIDNVTLEQNFLEINI